MWRSSPKSPAEIFPALSADYERVFGAHLISLVLFGSGAGEDYRPGQSDLNFLVTLTEQGIDRLDLALPLVEAWQKRRVAVPLMVTRSYLEGARDAYPIELLNMKRHYVVVRGEDILAGLTLEPRHVRLQLERELRGKLLHLRSGYLAAGGSPRRLRWLIGESVTAFVSLFRAFLYLKQVEVPASRREIIDAAGRLAGVQATTFHCCEAVRNRKDRLSADQVRALFRDYLKEVARLCEQVEAMEG